MTGNKKYCVIHGHFYQPPRESPWLGEIQRQPSAAPFHNWNERIFDECYRPNAFSRLLNNDGEIVGVSNNYSYMSFNFGPTLFRWLYQKQPEVYQRIVDADKESCKMYGGHGSAVAQVYNHIIMPHASRRDKTTQIKWAKTFFQRHFGRDPEGMWLAETAINMETAECLVEEGFTFAILSPNQAESFRFLDSESEWINADHAGFDPRHPYRLYLEDSKGNKKNGHLDLFFFDEPLSRAISFEDLLDNADFLSERINGCYTPNSEENELVTIATDGETFGHHKKNGDMCLAYYFQKKAAEMGIEVVNLAYYLSVNPPKREVRLKNALGEGTAWSCAHGTGRWIRDCGCNTGGGPGWNQKWRGPLRDGMDYLQSEIDQQYLREMIKYFDHPWTIRDLYEPHFENLESGTEFLKKYAARPIADSTYPYLVSLLEAQRYMLYGYTSCAWFFNDIAGIETVQNYRYAVRAWQLTWQGMKSNEILRKFTKIAKSAISNLPVTTGETILLDEVFPMINHLERAAFTAAVDSYIYSDRRDFKTEAYEVSLERFTNKNAAAGDWMLFRASVHHIVSLEQENFILAIINAHGHQIQGAVFPLSVEKIIEDENSSFNEILQNRAVAHFDLRDVFSAYKEFMTDQFIEEFATDNILDYLSWAGVNNSRLDAITELNSGLPDRIAGTVKFFLDKEWELHIMQIVKRPTFTELSASLTDVITKAEHYGITLDKEHSGHLIDKAVRHDVQQLIDGDITRELVNVVKYKLEIIRQFDIPIRYSQLQDLFYILYKKTRTDLYTAWVNKGQKNNDIRSKVQMVNELAHLFGYSTESTQL